MGRNKWKRHGRPKLTAAAKQPPSRAAAADAKPFRIVAAARGSALAIRAAEDGSGKLATFEGVAYTGAVMRPMGWWHDVVIDLAGVQVPSQHQPALRQHDHEQIVGHTETIDVDQKDGIRVAGVFSGEKQHTDKVTIPAANGFQWQLSVGADPVRTEFLESGEETVVNGRTVKGPLTISRETRLGEISFVPLGADDDTSVNVAAQKGDRTMNHFALSLKSLMAELRAASKSAKYTDAEIDEMSMDDAKAALKKCMASDDEDDEDDEDDDNDEPPAKKSKSSKTKPSIEAKERQQLLADLRRELAGDLQRQTEIRALCSRYGIAEVEIDVGDGTKAKVNLADHAIGAVWTLDRVKAAVLDHVRSERPNGPVGVPGGLGFSISTPAMSEAVLEAAVLHGLRHSLLLNDDSFYYDVAPDQKTRIRRVPLHVEEEARRDFRLRYTDQVQQAAHTLFKGRLGLHQLFACGMQGMGHRGTLDLKSEQGMRSMLATWDHLEKGLAIRAEGASNLSIGNILANVLNKFALQGYLFTEQAWREIAAIRPVTDFKPTKSINLLGQTMFKAVGPSGELVNFNLGDQAFANQAQPFGGILTIPWTHLVNDDLGILGTVPLKVGQGAGLALNDWFWALWASLASGSVVGTTLPSNYTLTADDGNAFWRTTAALTAANAKAGKAYNLNKITGAGSALSSSALQTAKKTFDNQVDPNGNPLGFDGLMPLLLFGPTNWRPAMELISFSGLVYGGSTVALQPQGNVWAGGLKPVMSRYIENANYGNSATAWWVLYNPVALAVIEVCFLNGVDTPTVLQAGPDYQFDRLGVSIRGTMPFGANQQNFRGGVYSQGS